MITKLFESREEYASILEQVKELQLYILDKRPHNWEDWNELDTSFDVYGSNLPDLFTNIYVILSHINRDRPLFHIKQLKKYATKYSKLRLICSHYNYRVHFEFDALLGKYIEYILPEIWKENSFLIHDLKKHMDTLLDQDLKAVQYIRNTVSEPYYIYRKVLRDNIHKEINDTCFDMLMCRYPLHNIMERITGDPYIVDGYINSLVQNKEFSELGTAINGLMEITVSSSARKELKDIIDHFNRINNELIDIRRTLINNSNNIYYELILNPLISYVSKPSSNFYEVTYNIPALMSYINTPSFNLSTYNTTMEKIKKMFGVDLKTFNFNAMELI